MWVRFVWWVIVCHCSAERCANIYIYPQIKLWAAAEAHRACDSLCVRDVRVVWGWWLGLSVVWLWNYSVQRSTATKNKKHTHRGGMVQRRSRWANTKGIISWCVCSDWSCFADEKPVVHTLALYYLRLHRIVDHQPANSELYNYIQPTHSSHLTAQQSLCVSHEKLYAWWLSKKHQRRVLDREQLRRWNGGDVRSTVGKPFVQMIRTFDMHTLFKIVFGVCSPTRCSSFHIIPRSGAQSKVLHRWGRFWIFPCVSDGALCV